MSCLWIVLKSFVAMQLQLQPNLCRTHISPGCAGVRVTPLRSLTWAQRRHTAIGKEARPLCRVIHCRERTDGSGSQSAAVLHGNELQTSLLKEGFRHIEQAKQTYAKGEQLLSDNQTEQARKTFISAGQQAKMALDKFAEQIQESQELMGIKGNASEELQQVLLGLMLGSFSGAFLKTALRITLPLLTLTGISVAVTSLETVSDFTSSLQVANAKFWFISFVFVSSAAAGVWESLEKVAEFRAAMDATEDNQSEGNTNGLPDPFDLTREKTLSNELERGTDEVEELLNNVETILERLEKERLANQS